MEACVCEGDVRFVKRRVATGWEAKCNLFAAECRRKQRWNV